MDCARISTLLEPFLASPLADEALGQISTYIDLLLRWNARVNLTALRSEEDIVTRHFGESFFLARHVLAPVTPPSHALPHDVLPQADQKPGPARDLAHRLQVIDVGSGAGFPGLPLKIWDPAIDLTLIEANHKKAAFLRETIRALRLMNVNVLAARAETLATQSGFTTAGLVTLRAVEHFEAIVPVATNLVAPGGRLALLIGSSQVQSLTSLAPEVAWQSPVPIPRSQSRVLTLGSKK